MIDDSELRETIRKRAEEIYIESGKAPGNDLENWTQAEAEVMGGRLPRRASIVVEVNGVQFAGEYSTDSCGGYKPGEFEAGQELALRFDGQKMFIKRTDGSELETTITD
ncbi:MAG TPA: DUF2934 domain-containing protein [Candidatus Sulfotelmatobacter sp.]|nr:DUF2934 domain-containing protein [Candidatus Sulfotelmatobacter sp.]